MLNPFPPPRHQAGLEVTWEAGQAFGVVGGAAVGGLSGCCMNDTPATAAATQLATLGLVFCAPCTMPCYFADSAALIDGDATSWSVDCAAFACAMPCLLCCVVSSGKRFALRHALGLKGERQCCSTPEGRSGDLCTHGCCLPCALVEERKVLLKNGCTRDRPAVAVHAEIMGRGGGVEAPAVKFQVVEAKADADAKVQLVEAKADADVDSDAPAEAVLAAEPVMHQPSGTKIP
jgi:hypothetical protein